MRDPADVDRDPAARGEPFPDRRDPDADPDAGRAGDPAASLRTLRLVWLGLVASLAVLGPISLMMRGLGGAAEADVATYDAGGGLGAAGGGGVGGVGVAWVLLVVAVLVGFFLRNQIYKQHWRGSSVTPAGYVTGNLVFFGIIEGPGVVAAVLLMVGSSLLPTLLPLLISWVILLVNYPTGGPMRPTGPRLGVSER